MNWREIMTCVCDEYRAILGGSLKGVYVHGSIAFGCFHPQRSDIDFLAVTDRAPTPEEKARMIRTLLRLAPHAPEKGIEMSVVDVADCRSFTHPMPYHVHYSAAHHAAYLADMDAALARLQGTDPDLAAHITVTRHVGIALLGPEPREMFAPVPPVAYLDSIRADVENAVADVTENPVYVLLNLCRVLAYIKDGSVLSKAQGGEWGLVRLPQNYRPMLQQALDAYRTDGAFAHDAGEMRAFAQYMLANINDPAYPL